MSKILYLIIASLIIANCSFKPVVKHHGIPSLEKKQASLIINKSNKNDIRKLLGKPSTKSKFDNDVWIYIERKQTQSQIKNLGRMKILKNDVLVLEIDNFGILKNKEFWSKDFFVDRNTLIPRPETELLCEKVITKYKNKNIQVLDIGTGTGCIILSLLSELKNSTGIGIDI